MKKFLLTFLVLSLAISACSAKNEEPSASLTGTWKLTSYGPSDVRTAAVPDAGAELTFNEDGTITGNSGCNGFGGKYTVEGDQVAFSEVVSTLMACDDPRMQQEDAIHKALTGTASYKIENHTLTLTNNDIVLVLSR